MKKTVIYLLTGLSLLAGQACRKATTTTTTSVNDSVDASVNTSESYRYALPATNDNSTYIIENPGSKSAITSIVTDSNGSTFVYTPAANSSGADAVVISNTGSQPAPGGGCGHHPSNGGGNCSGGGHHHHHHDCDKQSKTIHTITFNITVNGVKN